MRARFVLPLIFLPAIYVLLSRVLGLIPFEAEGLLLMLGIVVLVLAIGFLNRKSIYREIEHPSLGTMFSRDSSNWRTLHPTNFGSSERAYAFLSGTQDGPSAESLALLRECSTHYDEIRNTIAPTLFELCDNCFSDAPSCPLSAPSELWGTETLIGLSVQAPSQLSFTYHFSWQDPRDGHDMTVYLSDWRVVGTTIDG